MQLPRVSSPIASPWAPDAQAPLCSLCSQAFTLFLRRHHCRSCGLVICNSCSKSRRLLVWIDPKSTLRVCDKCECCFSLQAQGVDSELIVYFIVHQLSLVDELFVLKRFLSEQIAAYKSVDSDGKSNGVFVHIDTSITSRLSVKISSKESMEPLFNKCERDLYGLRRNGSVFHVLEGISESKVWLNRIFAITSSGDLALSNIDCQDYSDAQTKDFAVRMIRPISQVRSLSTKRVVLAEKVKGFQEVLGRAVCIRWRDDGANLQKETVLVVPGTSNRDMEKSQKELLETVKLHVELYHERKLARIADIRQKRTQMGIPVNWDHPDHAAFLERLWVVLKPEVPFPGRKSDLWKDIGFQGKDPQTDFRGTGYLGLRCVVYWAESLGELAREMVHNCRQYPVCTAAINLVQMLDDLIGPLPSPNHESGSGGNELLLTFCHQDTPHNEAFEQIFCALLMRFDRTFQQQNATYMDFPRIRQQFLQEVNTMLDKHPFSYATLHRWLADV
uniref:FYVE-type domain-containing protein n=1 Tax=Spongospora subterranea TaxID=70186 RepID=A0A0H5R973_9EUKA|eukprot:CRZ10301.1 hypothetical protein [Spongospora subterranea]